MMTNNPFAELALNLPPIAMQFFVIAMILLVIAKRFEKKNKKNNLIKKNFNRDLFND